MIFETKPDPIEFKRDVERFLSGEKFAPDTRHTWVGILFREDLCSPEQWPGCTEDEIQEYKRRYRTQRND